MITKEQFTARTLVARTKGFESWMDKPEVRVLVSMIPASDQKDLVNLLLQSAFNSGFDIGSGDAIIMMVESMMERKPR